MIRIIARTNTFIFISKLENFDFLVVTVEISSRTNRTTVRGQDRVQQNVIILLLTKE